jgi:hypothetical protein
VSWLDFIKEEEDDGEAQLLVLDTTPCPGEVCNDDAAKVASGAREALAILTWGLGRNQWRVGDGSAQWIGSPRRLDSLRRTSNQQSLIHFILEYLFFLSSQQTIVQVPQRVYEAVCFQPFKKKLFVFRRAVLKLLRVCCQHHFSGIRNRDHEISSQFVQNIIPS